MAERVSLMVLPSSPPEAPPQILLEQSGVWRDMMPADQSANAEDIQKTKRDIDAYFGKIMGEVENNTAHTADSVTLKGPFANFYKRMVTSSVRTLLRDAADRATPGDPPELHVHAHTYVEWLPWEMFHDGKDFLGLRFRIARLPITTQVPNVSAKQVTVQKVYNLLATNFLDATQQARWDNTFDGILPAGIVKPFPPPPPNIDNVFNARDADILHITCHGGFRDQDDNVYWTLDSTSAQPLNYEIKTTQFDLEGLGYDTTPLVFGNACASTDSGGGTRKNGLIPSYGAAFFASGALNFVGTFAPITRDLAVDFAGLFYQKLLGAGGGQPLPIAQALWATKQHYRSAAVNSADPSYLFYCLYGPPDTVFRP